MNRRSEGTLPGCRYGSFNGVPLTVTRPSLSQQATVSPPTPTTRLIRSCSFEDGSSPIQVRNCLACLMTTGSSLGGFRSSSSQPPGSLNTTTSPRDGFEPNHGVSLSTSTRSPILIVCSIEPDGITNAWTRKVLSTRAITSATPIRIGISFMAERRRLRLIRRWTLRRSARPPRRGPVRGASTLCTGPEPGM